MEMHPQIFHPVLQIDNDGQEKWAVTSPACHSHHHHPPYSHATFSHPLLQDSYMMLDSNRFFMTMTMTAAIVSKCYAK